MQPKRQIRLALADKMPMAIGLARSQKIAVLIGDVLLRARSVIKIKTSTKVLYY